MPSVDRLLGQAVGPAVGQDQTQVQELALRICWCRCYPPMVTFCCNGRGCATGSNCRDFRAETRWSLNPGEAAKIWVHQRGKAASRQLLPAAAQSTVPAPALDRSRSAASCSDMASMMKRTSSSCATSSRRPEPFVAAASRASVRVMAQAQQPAPVNAASKQMFTAAQAPSRSVVTRVAAAEAPASTSTSTKVRAGAWHWKLWTWA